MAANAMMLSKNEVILNFWSTRFTLPAWRAHPYCLMCNAIIGYVVIDVHHRLPLKGLKDLQMLAWWHKFDMTEGYPQNKCVYVLRETQC